jgi:hypothetical protein
MSKKFVRPPGEPTPLAWRRRGGHKVGSWGCTHLTWDGLNTACGKSPPEFADRATTGHGECQNCRHIVAGAKPEPAAESAPAPRGPLRTVVAKNLYLWHVSDTITVPSAGHSSSGWTPVGGGTAPTLAAARRLAERLNSQAGRDWDSPNAYRVLFAQDGPDVPDSERVAPSFMLNCGHVHLIPPGGPRRADALKRRCPSCAAGTPADWPVSADNGLSPDQIAIVSRFLKRFLRHRIYEGVPDVGAFSAEDLLARAAGFAVSAEDGCVADGGKSAMYQFLAREYGAADPYNLRHLLTGLWADQHRAFITLTKRPVEWWVKYCDGLVSWGAPS